MKVTTVRFGGDLWRLLEAEAALAGVSVSQYIREAALARAAAAAAIRGEDPFVLLSGSAAQPVREKAVLEPAVSSEKGAGAAAARQRAAVTRVEAAATAAQSKQAIRRAQQLAQKSGSNARSGESPSEDTSGHVCGRSPGFYSAPARSPTTD